MKYYLAKSVQNLFGFSEALSQPSFWSENNSIYSTDIIASPSGRVNATTYVDCSASFSGYLNCPIPSSVTNAGSLFTISVYVGKTAVSSAFPRFTVRFFTNTPGISNEYNDVLLNTITGAYISRFESKNGTVQVDDVGSFWRFGITCVKSMDYTTDNNFYMYPGGSSVWDVASDGMVNQLGSVTLWGAQLNMGTLAPYTRTESITVVGSSTPDFLTIMPEYNYELTGKKIEDRKRARSGREYVYKWGQYEGRKFDVSYVSDADKTKINSWWSGNDSLLFIDGITTAVTSVRIQNDKTPISKLEKPYTNLWNGTIELETY